MMKIFKHELASLGNESVEECKENWVESIEQQDEETTIQACSGIHFFYAKPSKPMAKADLDRIRWSIEEARTGLPIAATMEWVPNKDRLMLSKVPEALHDRKVVIRASLAKKFEAHLTAVVKRCQVCEFIDLVRTIESGTGWDMEKVANAIRHVVPEYDTEQWQILLNRDGPATGIEEGMTLSDEDRTKLVSFVRHDVNASGTESGFGMDCFGYQVALGHVITGICAGMRREKSIDVAAEFARRVWGPLGLLAGMSPFGEKLDNLYATTIAGDLGQCAWEAFQKDPTDQLIGKGTEATDAELIGDIDGFLLGNIAMSSSNGKLSDFLENYYCSSFRDGIEVVASVNRFNIMMGQDIDVVRDESEKFAIVYNYSKGIIAGALGEHRAYGGFLRLLARKAVKQFESWLLKNNTECLSRRDAVLQRVADHIKY